jgi:hypothetical protein
VVRVFHQIPTWQRVLVRAIATALLLMANLRVFKQLSLRLHGSTSLNARTVWQADCTLPSMFASDISDTNGGSLYKGRHIGGSVRAAITVECRFVTFARAVFFAVLLTSVFVTSVKADTLYTYVSDKFKFAQGVYAPGDQITGSFILSASFVPPQVTGPPSVTSGVLSYSFTDGHQTLNQSNSTGTFQVGFNWGGTPVVPGTGGPNSWWVVYIQTPTSGIQTLFGGDYQMIAWIGAAKAPPICSTGPTQCGIDPSISAAMINSLGPNDLVGGLPGTWTIQTPEGGSTALFLFAGIVGLLSWKRGSGR